MFVLGPLDSGTRCRFFFHGFRDVLVFGYWPSWVHTQVPFTLCVGVGVLENNFRFNNNMIYHHNC